MGRSFGRSRPSYKCARRKASLRSAQRKHFPFPPDSATLEVNEAPPRFPRTRRNVRLALSRTGILHVQTRRPHRLALLRRLCPLGNAYGRRHGDGREHGEHFARDHGARKGARRSARAAQRPSPGTYEGRRAGAQAHGNDPSRPRRAHQPDFGRPTLARRKDPPLLGPGLRFPPPHRTFTPR